MFQEIRVLSPQRIVYVDRPFHAEGPDGGPHGAWMALGRYTASNNLGGRTTLGVGIMLDPIDKQPKESVGYRAAYVIPDGEPLPADDDAREGQSEAGKFAVFLYTGPWQGLGDAWGRVMGEAFPATGLTIRDAPMFEVYLDDQSVTPPEQLRTEIFIPVE